MSNAANDVKITVIVTVHNAEQYLEECLDSIISQTFSNIEILCMDGGSTDSSPQILSRYAARDARIHVINDSNTSYGYKVNEGIRCAKGTYIAMLESDDMYRPDMLERLLEIAEQYEADYVNGDYFNIFDIKGKRFQELVRMYPEGDYGKLLEPSRHPENMRQILRYWTGLFRRSFLLDNKIWMNESPGASFQDMSFRFLTSALADRAYHLDVPVYLYRVDNPGSSVYDPKKAVVIADEFDFLKRELIKKKIENRYIWQHYYIWKYNDFYGNLQRFDDAARKDLFERCYGELERDRDTLILLNRSILSGVIESLLTKTKEKVWKDIDESYRDNWKREQRRYTFLENLGENKIVIFGCGRIGNSAADYLESIGLSDQIYCFADNSKEYWGTSIKNCLVLEPAEAVKRYPDSLYLVASKYYEDEIASQLRKLGIQESNIYRF